MFRPYVSGIYPFSLSDIDEFLVHQKSGFITQIRPNSSLICFKKTRYRSSLATIYTNVSHSGVEYGATEK
jgi:hypothetical protein